MLKILEKKHKETLPKILKETNKKEEKEYGIVSNHLDKILSKSFKNTDLSELRSLVNITKTLLEEQEKSQKLIHKILNYEKPGVIKRDCNSKEFKGHANKLKKLYKIAKPNSNQKKNIKELERIIEEDYGILVARSSEIKDTSISMLSRPDERWLLLPDFNNEEQLKELGFQKNPNDNQWYHNNKEWYSDPLGKDSVIYIFKKDENGKPTDTGFGARNELKTMYIRSENYDIENLIYIDTEKDGKELVPGEIISVKKCASGSFCILPVGTKIFTPEGLVTVNQGDIINIKESKNTVHLSNISDIPNMYQADPFNPASVRLFELITHYKEKEANLDNEEKINFQNMIANEFSMINRGQNLCVVLGEENEIPKSLHDTFTLAQKVAKKIDEEYLSKIDVSNFDNALNQAEKMMIDVYANKELNDIQKEVILQAIMVKLMPKTNAHQHLKGSVPKEVVLKLAKKKGFDEKQIEEIENAYLAGEKGYTDLNEFNKAYGTIGRPINTGEDYIDAIQGIIDESLKHGQLTTEIRCACDSIKKSDTEWYSPEEGAEFIISAINKAKENCIERGIEPPKTGYVFLSYRGRDWDKSIESAIKQAQVAVQMAEKYPDMKFGFDVAGPEDTGYPPNAFKEAIDTINAYNFLVVTGKTKGQTIGITMHAGETPTFDGEKPGNEAIEQLIKLLNGREGRDGHGVQGVRSKKTLAMMKNSNLTIEICGTCNINSIPKNTQDHEIHPLETFLKLDIPITLCTDNDSICGTNITREYLQFLISGHSNIMNWNSLKKCARNGIESAFIPDNEKEIAMETLNERLTSIQDLYDRATNNHNEN